MPSDLEIIESLIDANCRAHSEVLGFHYDSRCLSHYNDAINRLIEAGMLREVDDVPLRRETVVDMEEPRIRAKYIPSPRQVKRPSTDPLWQMALDDNARLRDQLAAAQQAQGQPASVGPPLPVPGSDSPPTPTTADKMNDMRAEAGGARVPHLPPKPMGEGYVLSDEVIAWINQTSKVTPPDPLGTPHDTSNMPEETPQ